MSKLLHKAIRQKNENAFSVYQQHLANRPVNVSAQVIYFFLLFIFQLFMIDFIRKFQNWIIFDFDLYLVNSTLGASRSR